MGEKGEEDKYSTLDLQNGAFILIFTGNQILVLFLKSTLVCFHATSSKATQLVDANALFCWACDLIVISIYYLH